MNEDQMTPEQQANQCWFEGGKSTDNPYIYFTIEWCVWAREFMRLNDQYMAKAVES